jgi:poly(A) polymerase/tRNA nucleotidyltransferase (CCA-adding enzyme)
MDAYALPPGPRVGRLLEAVREAQAVGRIATREQALEFGRAWLQENAE